MAFSYLRSLIGSFNLSREGVKYAKRYFENDYWDYATHTGIFSIQIWGKGGLSLDDVTLALKSWQEAWDADGKSFDVLIIL